MRWAGFTLMDSRQTFYEWKLGAELGAKFELIQMHCIIRVLSIIASSLQTKMTEWNATMRMEWNVRNCLTGVYPSSIIIGRQALLICRVRLSILRHSACSGKHNIMIGLEYGVGK